MSSEVTTTTIQVNGMEFFCRTAGLDNDGELVLFLHGFPETSLIWVKTMEKLAAAGYRCVAPDQRGYSPGARPKGYENYTFRKLAEDVIGFADYFAKDELFHLVGHDIGAALGWNVVTLYPRRIQTWTALSVPDWPAYEWAREHDPEQKKKGSYVDLFAVPFVPEELLRKDDYAVLRNLWKGFDQKEIDTYLELFSQKGALTAVVDWYRAIVLCKDTIVYGKIDVPTEFIWGMDDLAIAPGGVQKSHEYMGGYYSFHQLKQGHWLTEFDEPEVSAIIKTHIEKFPVSAGGRDAASPAE